MVRQTDPSRYDHYIYINTHTHIVPVSRRSGDPKRLPVQILEAQAKLVGSASLRTPDGNSARKEEKKKRRHEGNQSFQELVHFFFFPGLLLYFKSYIEINGKYKVTRGQQS